MDSAAEILVIILAVVLSIFLIVGIILVVYLIKLSAEIRRIAHSAQHAVTSVESVVSSAARFTSPIAIAEMLAKYGKKVMKSSRKGK